MLVKTSKIEDKNTLAKKSKTEAKQSKFLVIRNNMEAKSSNYLAKRCKSWLKRLK